MNTSDSAPRVVLLARPGAARDTVRGALLDLGAELVVEDDPAVVDPDAIRRSLPRLVMVLLDATTEDALGRLDAVLGDSAIEVLFEEAEVATGREGWEAARWRRHLSAKLHRRADVLPPSASVVPAVDALSVRLEELIAADDGGMPDLAPADLPLAGSDFSVFDPVAAENGGATDDGFVLSLHGLDLDTGAPDALPPLDGPVFDASDFDPLLAELDAGMPEPQAAQADWHDGLVEPQAVQGDWQGGLVEEFTVQAPVAPTSPSNPAPPSAPVAQQRPTFNFGELSLVDDDAATPAAAGRQAPAARDLGELDRRIANLELVDDSSPAGAVLVLAGVGGPDAVRQLLGALPHDFPRAVLLRQHLEGARYDKLVAQLQRASTLPVSLAVAGEPARAGHVHVVPDDVGLDATGQRFNAGSGCLLETLPAANSAIVVLSGADAANAPRIAALKQRGAFVAAQAADGCYDAAAASAMSAQGAYTAPPSDLAQQLAQRWRS